MLLAVHLSTPWLKVLFNAPFDRELLVGVGGKP
jgi:hypothetical protein